MNQSERLLIIDQFTRKSLEFDINDQLPYVLMAQCTVSYHQFLRSLVKKFGCAILTSEINASVEINKIKTECNSMKAVVKIAQLALKRSTSEKFVVYVVIDGERFTNPVIKYSSSRKRKKSGNAKIYQIGTRKDEAKNLTTE